VPVTYPYNLQRWRKTVQNGTITIQKWRVTVSAPVEGIVVAKEASGSARRTTPVKIETGLVRKAKTIAEEKGVDLSDYLSGVIRAPIERDWTRILKKIVEAEEGDRK
jgi:hypothetical protein